MADRRERNRMVFETSEVVKRAIRSRAGITGMSPADVINQALEQFLAKEISEAKDLLGSGAGAAKEPRRRKKESPAEG